MIEGIVYFNGPQTKWAKKVSEREIIARFPARWPWLARMRARSLHSQLDATRVGYAVLRDGKPLELVEAK